MPELSDDDAAFISELMSELVRDLHDAGVLESELDPLDSSIYQEVEDDVTRRVKIWAASKGYFKGKFPQDPFTGHVFMTIVQQVYRQRTRTAFLDLPSWLVVV